MESSTAPEAAGVEFVDENGGGAGVRLRRQSVNRSPSTSLAATSYHEAGHAVAAAFSEIAFDYVTIAPNPQNSSSGHVSFLQPAKRLEVVHKRGMITLAGEAAQRRFRPRSVRRHHGSGDRASVVDYALQHCGSQRQAEALVHFWAIQAEEFVEFRWSSIERVATALIERTTLAVGDVRELVFEYRAIQAVP